MNTVMPKYCYPRGQRIWMRIKNESGTWVNRKTPYALGQEEQAGRYVAATMRGIAMKVEKGITEMLTVAQYIERWLSDRESRDIAAAVDERIRLEKYVVPHVGKYAVDELRPQHVRDMVRTLRALKNPDGTRKLAPRTQINIYNTLHTVYESAVIEELVVATPVKVHKSEFPAKVDADPEWRSQATYTVREVERLISDTLIPVERRVMYALKAIAGLRHGEAAALRWRHLDNAAEPLARLNIVQAWCSRSSRVKGTKTEQTRQVPVHPVLAKILAVWKLSHWARVYGRPPKDDDFIVPTRTMSCVAVKDANEAMKRDLDALAMRKEAGTRRDRGGHDLRSWYKTRMTEDGADSLIIQRTTHAPPKDVEAGYQRYSWNVMCREVSKLKVEILDGKVLELVTESLQAEKKAGGRWSKVVTPSRLESVPMIGDGALNRESLVDDSSSAASRNALSRTRSVTGVTAIQSRPLKMIEKAIRDGDGPRALQILRDLDALGIEVPAIEPTRASR